jgi:phosphatidylethanolamine-binding protein (PEBP) family uncharacterized protein
MMRSAFRIASGLILVGVTALAGCSGDDDDDTNSSAGSSGTAGSSGNAGAGGMDCDGDPPITPHNNCDEIESQKEGDEGFSVTSPDFTSCGEMPASMTCDGKDFGTGVSPEFSWTGAPADTMSFAAVFKDISILSDGNPATEKLGYHWVMWDIPATTTGLPGSMTGGYDSAEVAGAHQWSSLGSYGFFTPCPNPFPRDLPMFMCSLTRDSYAFTLYALPTATLDDLPEPDLDDTGMPVAGSNWVVKMAHYIENLDALAVTEYRGTSAAWAAAFVRPNAEKFPCTKAMVDDSMTDTCLH